MGLSNGDDLSLRKYYTKNLKPLGGYFTPSDGWSICGQIFLSQQESLGTMRRRVLSYANETNVTVGCPRFIVTLLNARSHLGGKLYVSALVACFSYIL